MRFLGALIGFLLIGLAHSYPQLIWDNQFPFGFDSSSVAPTTATPPSTATASALSPRYFACLQSCPATSEYNPICGTDNVSYYNGAKFNCAVQCGNNIQRLNSGACPSLG
ncbi:uncharacterized protein Dwil_GK27283 [Drosophila willistoni]|uniref:Kazal-like domain-containing protein n=1 Tax=Drosophila willistoni TaxID=7260 RepID=A0A0Q9WSQ5_DROWI|nr:uncharacterized protein LOC26529285 [Drosophila willistoni]KRF98969.1 uncharacterized protein Dwil_GK27283 [Drosophila willistoni]